MKSFIPTLALAGKVLVIIVADKFLGVSDMVVGAFGKFGKSA